MNAANESKNQAAKNSKVGIETYEINVPLVAQLREGGSHIDRPGIAALENKIVVQLEVRPQSKLDDVFVEIGVILGCVKFVVIVVQVIQTRVEGKFWSETVDSVKPNSESLTCCSAGQTRLLG